MKESWISHFMSMAELVARKSKDPSTKVGCILVAPDMSVISTGFNGFPRGCFDTPNLYENREIKIRRIAHAELNAIAQAAKNGSRTGGCIAVVTLHPCSQCTAALINAGISEVICPPIPSNTKWLDSFLEAKQMLLEAGVPITYWTKQ